MNFQPQVPAFQLHRAPRPQGVELADDGQGLRQDRRLRPGQILRAARQTDDAAGRHTLVPRPRAPSQLKGKGLPEN